MSVAQMLRHSQRAAGTDIFQRGVNCANRAVALVRGGDVNRRLGQWNPRFRPADKFRGGQCGVRQHQRHRISQPNIFGGANDDASGDETRVFAGVDHFCEPVKRGVGVAAAHGFDERGNRVVMGVAIAVIHDGFFLDALLGDCERDADNTIGIRRRRERGNFQRVERLERVAVGDFGTMAQGVFIRRNFHEAEAAFGVGQRALQQ